MVCQFCELIQDDVTKYIVFENENFLAFLDKRPLLIGHCLLVPKVHYQTFYQLPDELATDFLRVTKKLGLAIEKSMNAQGSFIAINNTVSQSVPHLHVHLVPRNKGDGLKGFFWPRTQYVDEAHMRETQAKIKHYLSE